MVNCITICQPASELAGDAVSPEPLACRICELQANPQQRNAATVHLAVKHVRHDTPRLNAILQAHGDLLKDYKPPDEPLNVATGNSRLRAILAGNGVGSQLWRLLEEIDVKHTPTCPCLDWAERMNAWGPAGCRLARAEIAAHLKDSAKAYGWAKVAVRAARTGLVWQINPLDPFGSLVDEAIRLASRSDRPDRSGRSDRSDIPAAPFDIDAHFHRMPYHPVTHRIAAATCHFNPAGAQSRERCYHHFRRQFPAIGMDLWTAEGSYDASWYVPPGPHCLRFDLDPAAKLFCKENLLNLLIDRLPDQYEYVLWIDADVLLLAEDYTDRLTAALTTHRVVQGFSELYYLGARNQPITNWRLSMAYRNQLEGDISTDPALSYPGLCWAADRQLLAEIGGLYDRVITGGGDIAWASAVYGSMPRRYLDIWPSRLTAAVLRWCDDVSPRVPSVGFVEARGVHLWHGSLHNRHYVQRNALLRDERFDPAMLEYSPNGTLRWADTAPATLRDGIRGYLHSRKEDEA